MNNACSSMLMLALLVLAVTGCTTGNHTASTPSVEPGVTIELAKHRKATLGKVAYKLSMDIPAGKSDPIPASEVLTFEIDGTPTDLQIDFKETTDHISRIVVNEKPIAVDHRNEHIIVPGQALKTGPNEIDIQFTAGDLSLNRNDEYLYTLLVPDRARTVFPCFDQPNLKASFQLSLTMPANWQALTNGPLQDSTSTGDRKTFNFQPSDTISTYLFAFAAGEFKKVTQTVGSRTMNFFHRETDEEKIAESIDPIFELHSQALGFLEQYTGIPYPFRKFDFVAIPDFQYGGMEHVGAIQYRASSLFLDKSATESRKIGRANLIAHETAHMWFGDLVTMDWFNDVWMKEVFANFMADKVSEVTFPDTGSDLKFLLNHYPAAYGVDRTPGANPIRQELSNLQEAGSLYGSIIYHKAPIVMKQLELLMGKEAFQNGLKEYLKRFAFSNATWSDLIAILDDLTPEDLATWNKVWVEEPFRPVFEFSAKTSDGKIDALTISQKSEQNSDFSGEKVWPQYFKIGLGYSDSLATLPVLSYRSSSEVSRAMGQTKADYVVFNTSGEGYGVFPLSREALSHQANWSDPVTRAAAYINNFENMLNATSITPAELISTNLSLISEETEELSVRQLAGQLTTAFWQFISAGDRGLLATEVENRLWAAMEAASSGNIRKMLFHAYEETATTKKAAGRLYDIWNTETPPTGVRLSEDDYTDLAARLCLIGHPRSSEIQDKQLERIKNEDRRLRWKFLQPALSADTVVRRQFFESLKQASQREKESWVATALSYLHHPLRQDASIVYLKPSLELLEEIQSTGDIFFPTAWLSSTFGTYQSAQAADIVSSFLNENPNYPPKLKGKILQATDDLFRASRMLRAGEPG